MISPKMMVTLRPILFFTIVFLFVMPAQISFAVDSTPFLWSKVTKPPLPLDLYNQAESGYTSLVWERNLTPGYYTINVKFETGCNRREFVLSVDYCEVAFYSGYFTRDGKAEPPIYRFDFIITEPGAHRIEISRHGIINTPATIHNETLRLLDIVIEQRTTPSVPDIYSHEHPAEGYNQLWGWHACSWYQRRDNQKITLDYWKKRIIEESAKWGANYVQMYPYINEGFFLDGTTSEAIRFAHQQGYVIDEHSGVGGDFEKALSFLDSHFHTYFDRATLPIAEVMDSWETEDGWVKGDFNDDETSKTPSGLTLDSIDNVIKTTDKAWNYNPGCVIGECFNVATTFLHYKNWLHEGYHGPNYAKVLMCAGSVFGNGYDDMQMMSPFPDDLAFKNEYNLVFRKSQANSRFYTTNVFGGGTTTDWITKECWDFFRQNAYAMRQGRLPLTSALSWLGDSPLVLPESVRRAVYAASFEPCRGSMAYRLAATGRDGYQLWKYSYWRGKENLPPFGLEARQSHDYFFLQYRAREWDPASSVRIHNGILAITSSAFGSQSNLVWDTENLGQFDINARTVSLSKNFFSTRLSEPTKPVVECRFPAGSEKLQQFKLKLPHGTYMLNVDYGAAKPFQTEVYLMDQYLGCIFGDGTDGRISFPFYVPDSFEHTLELRSKFSEVLPVIKATIVPTNYQVEEIVKIGNPNDDSAEFDQDFVQQKGKTSWRREFDAQALNTVGGFPPTLADQNELPRVVDIYFDGEAGTYVLSFRVRAHKEDQRMDITLNSHLYGDEKIELGQVQENGNDWYNNPGIYGRAGLFLLGTEWKTYQVSLVCDHRSGKRRHKFEISIPSGSDKVDIDSVTLTKSPINNEIALTGGHKSILNESFVVGNDICVKELRKLTMVADEPTAFLEITRQTNGGAVWVSSEFDYSGYDGLSFEGQKQPSSGSSEKIPQSIELNDSRGVLPPLNLFLTDKSPIKRLDWSDGNLELRSKIEPNAAKLQIVTTIRNGDSKKLIQYFQSNPHQAKQIASIEDKRLFTNSNSLTEVRLVEIANPKDGPYFVKEKGWWSVRGAQPIYKLTNWLTYLDSFDQWVVDKRTEMPMLKDGHDLIRLIIPAKQDVELQSYGFIDGLVRPGWGSQKQVLINDISKTGCMVRVLWVTPYIYAPRVEFSTPFTQVTLNGNAWSYHDDRHVFLPQKPGDYKIEVKNIKNIRQMPTLQSTAASVKSAVYQDNKLMIEIEKPSYVFTLPQEVNYKLFLGCDPTEFPMKEIEGAKLIREGHYGMIVEASQPNISVTFGERVLPPVVLIDDGIITGLFSTGANKK